MFNNSRITSLVVTEKRAFEMHARRRVALRATRYYSNCFALTLGVQAGTSISGQRVSLVSKQRRQAKGGNFRPRLLGRNKKKSTASFLVAQAHVFVLFFKSFVVAMYWILLRVPMHCSWTPLNVRVMFQSVVDSDPGHPKSPSSTHVSLFFF